MKPVEAELILNVKQNEQAAGQPDAKPGDIYKGKWFIYADIPQRYFEIISEHDKDLLKCYGNSYPGTPKMACIK